MKRWIIPSAVIAGVLLGSGLLYGVKSRGMDPIRNAPELKAILEKATEVDKKFTTSSYNDKLVGMYPNGTYHLPTTAKETARFLKANLLPSNGWKVEVYFSPWFSMGATKTDANGKVICKVNGGDEGTRIDRKDYSKGFDRSYLIV